MNFASCRYCAPFLVVVFLVMLGQAALAQGESAAMPDAAPNLLVNANFECGEEGYTAADIPPGDTKPNYYPNHWTVVSSTTIPILTSARIRFAKSCDGEAHVEKIEGRDSVLIRALDHETPPEPGKPFDVTLLQQVDVVSGATYSLSGWMLTLCGGSNTVPRNDCPEEYYMAKLLGIDPTGGVDPDAPSVQWVENRRNFVEPDGRTRIGWQNLRLGATAQAITMTVFARIASPFQWHGNHGFIDALSLVRGPTATLTATALLSTTAPLGETAPPTGGAVITLTWAGELGPDIPLIEGGRHELRFDLQYWHDANQRWRDILSDADAGEALFHAACAGSSYRFRVQPRAEQPEGVKGASPNQRYPGVWSEPLDIFVPAAPVAPGIPFTVTDQLFLPLLQSQRTC
ncbi:MAG: hypothetical protein IPM07_23485 [Anaerolineales bacterium]|nr:hypothetical protein [Anaerolineales bacterium]